MEPRARPMPAYAHGAVPVTHDPTLLSKLADLSSEFPIADFHMRLFRQLGCAFVYASRTTPAYSASESTWLVLIRFGAVLESRFGFTLEIPAIYSPFGDLQIRTTDGLEGHLADLPADRRSVTARETMVWAPDPNLATKLDSWSTPTRVLIPLPDESRSEGTAHLQRFIDALAGRLASRDLYSAKGFVTGDQFFGRDAELQQVADCLRTQEVIGIFGLRKTGKTSMLHELVRAHDPRYSPNSQTMVLVYQDLEYLPSLIHDPVSELIVDLTESIRRALKEAGLRTQELADLELPATPSQFRRALDTLLTKIGRGTSLVLLLDEIEYLCPPNPGTDTSGEGFQRVRQFLGSLRKLVQERDNFGLAIAGLASAAIESSELYGAPNPLFEFARTMYLRPFSIAEAERMLNTVGNRVSMHWTADAVALAHEMTDGHAMLLRELASVVLKDQKHARSNIAQIKRGQVHRAATRWQENVGSLVRDVLPHLRRYYQEEAELAVLLMDDPVSFGEFAGLYSESAARLERLGIIRREEGGDWQPSRLLELSHRFEGRPKVSAAYSGMRVAPTDSLVRTWVEADESDILEKKETLRAHGGPIPDEKVVDQVLKACLGLLNADGGYVLVGVSDQKELTGIGRDIKKCGDADRLILFLTDKIEVKIGNVGTDLLSPRLHDLDGLSILCITVQRCPSPVFPVKPIDDGKTGLFVRNNNSTRQLLAQGALDYTKRHWG